MMASINAAKVDRRSKPMASVVFGDLQKCSFSISYIRHPENSYGFYPSEIYVHTSTLVVAGIDTYSSIIKI